MNKFLLVHLKSEWARTNFLEKVLRSYNNAIQFKSKITAVHRLSENKLLISFQADDFFGFGKHYFMKDRNAAVFDGFPLPNGKPLQAGRVAEDLLSWMLNHHSIDSIYQKLKGEFGLGIYLPQNDEFFAFSDYTGLKPLYYIDNTDFAAISNRQFLLNPICTKHLKPSFDLLEASSLISQGNKFGAKSFFADVRLLTPGQFLKISRNGTFTKQNFSSQLWDSRNESTSADYDAACDALVENFNWIKYVPALNEKPIRLSLTGGEDSRLVLAMGLNSNIRDRITTFTYGLEDNPDIKAAEIVARAAQVPHEKKIFSSQPPGPVDIGGYWQGLSKHAFRFEGATGAWDGGWAKATKMNFDITGFSDFFFKRIRPSNAAVDIKSKADALSHFQEFQQPYDPLGIINELPKRIESSQIAEWIDTKLSLGAALNELPELYYQDNRFTWWSGALNSNVLTQVRVSPMSSKLAASVGLKQSLTDRRERRFIFEMMKRLSPHLLEVPYLNKKWPGHFKNLAPTIRLPETELSFNSTQNSAPPWQVLLAKHGNKKIMDFLLSNQGTNIFDLVNKERIIKVLQDPSILKTNPDIRSIINLSELMILLTGEWIIDKDEIEDNLVSNPDVETNIPEVKKILAYLSTKTTKIASPLIKRIFTIDIPKASIHNIRIDPLDKPGNAILHRIAIKGHQPDMVYEIPLQNNIHPNSQLKISSDTSHISLISSSNDPHFAFAKNLISELPKFSSAVLVIEVSLPQNCLFEVFFDTGTGFSRSDMYSKHV